MRTARYLVAVSGISIVAIGCGTKIAQTTYEPPIDRGASDAATIPKTPSTCGPKLKDRLSITTIDLQDDIRYKRAGYGGVPRDERIALDVQPNGLAQVAWLDNALTTVHVTPLTLELQRAGFDAVVNGFDLGGLVAHDNGFAVLTRRNDPGEAVGDIPDGGPIAPAAILVGYRDHREVFAAPLTGTLNITDAPDNQRRDCSTGLDGRLAFDGRFYGAYFVVRGCKGHWADGRYGDKLVYADTKGAFVRGGWSWGCSQNLGLRLLPEMNAFTSLCISDSDPQAGVNLVVGQSSRLLAREFTAPGYSGGEFGSVVKLNDGRYFVGWLSRGVRDLGSGMIDVAMEQHDVGYTMLSRDYVPIGRPTWLFSTPDADEVNLHVAPYGSDRLLLVWETVTNPQCKAGVCLGPYGGTHVRLIYTDGSFASEEETIAAPPNGADDIVVFPDLDLGWAFVPESRDYSALLSPSMTAPNVPAVRQIAIARFAYCSN
jgi:hypothetical protein